MTISLNQAKSELLLVLLPLYGLEEAKAIADRLLSVLFKVQKVDILLGKSVDKPSDWQEIKQRLALGEPFQYVLGQEFFLGEIFNLNQETLIPRPETEELVDWILADNSQPIRNVLDIGTGSGCISISLKKHRPDWTLEGWDIADNALEIAKINAAKLGAPVHFKKMDALNIQTEGTWDIMVSNPPYISMSEKAEMKSNVLDFEPPLALFVPDHDPTLFYKKILTFGNKALRPGGRIYFEINPIYHKALIELSQSLGFPSHQTKIDFRGNPRMLRLMQELN